MRFTGGLPHVLHGRRRVATTVLILSLIVSCAAFATDGTQLIGIGALQKGTGGAGVASPKDMTWVLLNPASIIDLGCRLDVNMELFAPYRTNEPHGVFGSDVAGEMDDNSIFFIPSMGYSWCLDGTRAAYGIGLYGVSGMGVDYDSPRTILPRMFFKNYDRRTQYSVAKVVFAGAYQLDGGWTLGFAPQLDYARFRSDMLTLKFHQTEGENEWDDAWGVGYSVGLYKVWDKLHIGAVYTSRQYFSRFDKYKDLFFEPMDIPQQIQVGFAYDIRPDLEMVLDYKWIDWDSVAQVGDDCMKGGFGWHDQQIVKGGLTWTVNDKWKLRCGFSHANAPIHDNEIFANALFPAVTTDHASVGFSYNIDERSAVHFTYMHAFNNTIKDNGKGDMFSLVGRGTEISLREDTFTMEYSFKFRPGSHGSRSNEDS